MIEKKIDRSFTHSIKGDSASNYKLWTNNLDANTHSLEDLTLKKIEKLKP